MFTSSGVAAGPPRPLGYVGLDHLPDVLRRREAVQHQPVADLAGHQAVVPIHSGGVHLGRVVLAGPRAEERRHQRELVKVALVFQVAARVPAVPDGPQRLHVLAQPRPCRAGPARREPPLDVSLHLRSQAQAEPAVATVLQVAGGVGHHHGRARKRDGNVSFQRNPAGGGGGYGQRQKRIVRRLVGGNAVVARRLGPSRLSGHGIEVAGF